MEDVDNGGYGVAERLDIANIDPRLGRFLKSTATQLLVDRAVKFDDLTTDAAEPTPNRRLE